MTFDMLTHIVAEDRRQHTRRQQPLGLASGLPERRGGPDRRLRPDRRRHLRILVDSWAREQLFRGYVYRRVHNISLGGLFMDHSLPLPIGHQLLLNINLPGFANPLRARGRVVSHGAEQGLGLSLTWPFARDAEMLRRFIEARVSELNAA